jgi:O-antigen/teichoic acid export membrane protein
LRNRLRPLIAAAMGLALMVGLGDLAIRILYDSRYHEAAWILPLLTLSIWPRVLGNMSEPALLTIGRPQYMTLGNIVRFLATVIGLLLGYSMAGLLGAVIAVSLRDIFYYVPVAIGLRRERLSVFSQDLMLTGVLAVSLLVVLAVRFLIGLGTPWESLL